MAEVTLEDRFAIDAEALALALGHADRKGPFDA
jgi:hypothetical protein